MKKWNWLGVLLIVQSITFVNFACGAEKTAPTSLPAIHLPTLEGTEMDSKDWKGKVVVLDFWATWCTGCRATIPILNGLHEKFKSQGLVVVGVSLDQDSKEKIGKFVRKQKMNYQILIDSEDKLSKVFGFEGIPSVYVFGKDGKLLKAMPAYAPEQEKELEAVVAAEFGKGK